MGGVHLSPVTVLSHRIGIALDPMPPMIGEERVQTQMRGRGHETPAMTGSRLAADPSALAARLRRPLPLPPNPMARNGTAFHAWLERRFGSTRLIDHDELPGAADEAAAPNTELGSLQAAFLASEWAQRSPYDVEVPFETVFDGVGVRGQCDKRQGDKEEPSQGYVRLLSGFSQH